MRGAGQGHRDLPPPGRWPWSVPGRDQGKRGSPASGTAGPRRAPAVTVGEWESQVTRHSPPQPRTPKQHWIGFEPLTLPPPWAALGPRTTDELWLPTDNSANQAPRSGQVPDDRRSPRIGIPALLRQRRAVAARAAGFLSSRSSYGSPAEVQDPAQAGTDAKARTQLTSLPSGCWDCPELPKHGENIHVVMHSFP
jgi:hypothetical protein